MTELLANHVAGRWQLGTGPGTELRDPVLGTALVQVDATGLNLPEAFAFARERGGATLRAATYRERGAMLGAVAKVLQAHRDSYYDIATANSGTVKTDSAVDIDGGIFTLGQYARWGDALGDVRVLRDGDAIRLGRDPVFQSQHLQVPRPGVALCINAFNFPAWGLWEEAAPALLSGMPVIVKPGTSTAWLTQRMVQDVVNAGVLPAGALSVIAGSSAGLMDALQPFDVVSFTGSAETAGVVRAHPAVAQRSVHANIEADSINAALLMLDTSDWPAAFLGCLYAGVVPVAVNTLLKPGDHAYMLTHCRAQAALVSGALLPVLNEALALAPHHEVRACVVSQPQGMLAAGAVDMQAAMASIPAPAAPARKGPDEPGFWLYSSGSTGKPKGTVHTQGSLWWTAELYGKAVLGLTDKDVCFSAAKLYFAYGLGNSLTFPLSVGATVVLMAERPTPDATFERWTRHQPTVFFGAPTGFAGMLASPRLPSRSAVALRMCSSAGEALPAEIAQRFKDHFGCDIMDGIGSTEMLHIFLSNRPGDVRYGTTGQPVPGYEISLRGEDGSEVSQGEIGDLYIQGPSAALMYWNNRAKTRETFQGAWTKSGDKYVRDAEGYNTYAGRSDDMLKVSGIYVSPFEVGATLMQHTSVLEAAVIGTQDADGLTKTKAFVVLKEGQAVTPDELKAFVKERLAPYKYPRLIEFLPELPKTATGKIQRFRLREREQRA